MSEMIPVAPVSVLPSTDFDTRFSNFDAATDHFNDTAYKTPVRSGLDQVYRNLFSGGRIMELAKDENVIFDTAQKAFVHKSDGSRVLKQGPLSLLNRISEMGMTDADIYKARRTLQRDDLLSQKAPEITITGVTDEGEITSKVTNNKSNRTRYRDVTGKSAESQLSNSADYYGFGEKLTAAENLAGLQSELLKLGKYDAVEDKNVGATVLQDRLETAGLERGERKDHEASQRSIRRQLLDAGYDLSPQAVDGLDPERGASRAQQRGPGGNNSGGFQMPENLLDSKDLPIAERLRRHKARQVIESEIISQNVEFGSKGNRYNRALAAQAEATRKYERKQDRLNALQDQEATFQYNRELAEMQHNQRQFEIREENKMRRAQWEKELEIEEQRRADADFDNLTKMIMGMAGNL